MTQQCQLEGTSTSLDSISQVVTSGNILKFILCLEIMYQELPSIPTTNQKASYRNISKINSITLLLTDYKSYLLGKAFRQFHIIHHTTSNSTKWVIDCQYLIMATFTCCLYVQCRIVQPAHKFILAKTVLLMRITLFISIAVQVKLREKTKILYHIFPQNKTK